MYAMFALLALMVFTWAAAVAATYAEPEREAKSSALIQSDETSDEEYYDAA